MQTCGCEHKVAWQLVCHALNGCLRGTAVGERDVIIESLVWEHIGAAGTFDNGQAYTIFFLNCCVGEAVYCARAGVTNSANGVGDGVDRARQVEDDLGFVG